MTYMTEDGTKPYPLLHPFTYMPEPSAFDSGSPYIRLCRAQGCWAYDEQNQAYLYATTGATSVGLGHPRVLEAIAKQYEALSFASTCAQSHPLAVPLAERLIRLCGGHYAKAFYSADGSGAVESAMRLARQYWIAVGQPKRTKFVSLEGGYHGTTFGSGSVTHLGIREMFGPGLAGCYNAAAPNLYRPPVEGKPEWIVSFCLDHLEETIFEAGPDEVAAVLLEPVQGVNGIVPLPREYVAGVRELTRKYGILLVMDEIGTGLGRAGHWTVSQHFGIQPDLLTVSKGLTGGYFPLTATLLSAEMDRLLFGRGGFFLHGVTLSGHPVGCAAAMAVLDILEEEGLVERSRREGDAMLSELKSGLGDHPFVGDVRGMGMMLAIEFVACKDSKQPVDDAFGLQLSKLLREAGVLGSFLSGVLTLYPPLTLSQDEARQLTNAVIGAVSRLS